MRRITALGILLGLAAAGIGMAAAYHPFRELNAARAMQRELIRLRSPVPWSDFASRAGCSGFAPDAREPLAAGYITNWIGSATGASMALCRDYRSPYLGIRIAVYLDADRNIVGFHVYD